MGMYSHNLPTGQRETITDFPYYLNIRAAKYYQKADRDGALEQAYDFAEYIIKRRSNAQVWVRDEPERQHVLVIEWE